MLHSHNKSALRKSTSENLQLGYCFRHGLNKGGEWSNVRLCKKLRLAFFFANPRHFDFFYSETKV